MASRAVRIHLTSNVNQKVKSLVVIKVIDGVDGASTALRESIMVTARNKLRVKKPSRLFLADGAEVFNDSDLTGGVRDGCTILVSSGEDFIGSTTQPQLTPTQLPTIIPHETVLILLYPDSQTLQNAIGRAHIFYEGGTLKGPLKGVNFPTSTYDHWLSTLQSPPPLTPQETQTTNLIKSQPPSISYIIATLASDVSTILHEWAHARFHLDPLYKSECEAAYERLGDGVRNAVNKDLTLWNYRPSVFVDEFQAYIVEDPSSFGRKWEPELREAHIHLKALCGRAPGIDRKG
ncbi:hypothetical protein HDU67_004910 [Dinochytrium kinnereticum]|nr:hypothetical protein HDU67_004910 [Dinochytrium kinnereticum]